MTDTYVLDPHHLAMVEQHNSVHDLVTSDAGDTEHDLVVSQPSPDVGKHPDTAQLVEGGIEPERDLIDEPVSEHLRRRGHVVTVYSPKGGVGTTVVAVNLAVALAGAGRHRVCLVDLDFEFGDVAIMTSVAPTVSIVDAVGVELDDDVVGRLVTPLACGVDAVLAPIDPSAADTISAHLVADLLDRLRAHYDYVVIDTPTQLAEHVLEAFDRADRHVIVTTPDIPALKNVRLLLDTLDLLGSDPSRRSLILNRAEPRSGLKPDEVRAAVGVPIDAVLTVSNDVAASVDAGQPLLARRRIDHPIATAIRMFATTTVMGEPAIAKRRTFSLGLRARTR